MISRRRGRRTRCAGTPSFQRRRRTNLLRLAGHLWCDAHTCGISQGWRTRDQDACGVSDARVRFAVPVERVQRALRGGKRGTVDKVRPRMLRQRPVREFLFDDRVQVDQSLHLRLPSRGALGGLRYQRRVLQPQASPLVPGLRHPRSI